MLNRTLGTSSASLNGLNLGTRSAAQVLGVVNGDLTLRVRPAHPQMRIHSMRGGVVAKLDYPRFRGKPITAIPGFSFPSSWWLARPFRSSGSEVVAEAPPTAWEVIVDGSPSGRDRTPVLERQQFRQGQFQESKQSTQTRSLARACWGRTTLAATPASAASASSGRRTEG
jgi:hypothetical protein